MSRININGSDDQFYRYKMQKLMCTKEKDSTTLINITSIAKDLNRPVEDILKFLKKNLNTSIINKHDKIKIKGFVETEKLQNIIHKYIHTYVICKKCDNPETVQKDNKLNCVACGKMSKIEEF